MTQAQGSHGTLLQRGDGADPEVFTTVAEVQDISSPEITKARHEATSQDSEGWTERKSGLKTLGALSFGLIMIHGNATHDHVTGLIADATSDEDRNYRLVYPDPSATTLTFLGTVTKFQTEEPVDGIIKAKCEIDPSGPPIWG